MSKIINLIHLSNLKRQFKFPLQIKNIGQVKVHGDKYSNIRSQNIEFCFRLKASVSHCVDIVEGKEFHSTFPHLFIKHPFKLHRYEYEHEREAFFIIYSANLKDKFTQFGIDTDKTVIEFNNNPKINRLIKELLELLKNCDLIGVADEIDLLAFNLICQTFCTEKQSMPNIKNNKDELKIRKFSSYIKMHYKEDLNLDLILRKYGFSRRSFYRSWMQVFTISPAKYITQLKMEEACYLLENHSYSINEIANILNFSDTAYFISTFKKYNLITPLAYRKKINRA